MTPASRNSILSDVVLECVNTFAIVIDACPFSFIIDNGEGATCSLLWESWANKDPNRCFCTRSGATNLSFGSGSQGTTFWLGVPVSSPPLCSQNSWLPFCAPPWFSLVPLWSWKPWFQSNSPTLPVWSNSPSLELEFVNLSLSNYLLLYRSFSLPLYWNSQRHESHLSFRQKFLFWARRWTWEL